MKFRRGMGRQDNLGMDNSPLSGVIMGKPVPFVGHFGSAPVSGSAHGRLGLAALDNLDGHMEYGYGGSPPFGWDRLASLERADAGRVSFPAERTRGLGSVAPHCVQRTPRPRQGARTGTVYKCAVGFLRLLHTLAFRLVFQQPHDFRQAGNGG